MGDADQPEIIEYLANISRTMTFFRRLVWGMVFVMLLNVVVMGIGVLYAVRYLGSVSGPVQLPANMQALGNAPAPGGPDAPGNVHGPLPPAGEALQQFGEYSRTVNELVNELQNQ